MSTYLELTNELLRRLQEVELTSTEFPTAVSVQATAKDCISASVNEILSRDRRWPFYYLEGTQLLTVGQEEYLLPSDAMSVDWNSFRIIKDDALNINTTPLRLISQEDWRKYLKAQDENSETDGRDIPKYVFDSDYTGKSSSGDFTTAYNYSSFGVSPSPNEAYTVKFNYKVAGNQLQSYNDECIIPARFNYVIIAGALKHFNFFKDNSEQGQFWTQEFDRNISYMRQMVIEPKSDMTDTRVNYGGDTWRSKSFGSF